MVVGTRNDVRYVASNFAIEGHFLDASPYGSGHINDTYISSFDQDGRIVRFLHQRINHSIFREPEKLMENIKRVTAYARERIVAAGGDPSRETLTLIPTVGGNCYYRSPEGDYWRTYIFIEDATTYDQVENPNHIYAASRAFGEFQKTLATLPGERLHETIPNFHNTHLRYKTFTEVLVNDPINRAAFVKREINFVLEREEDTSIIVDMLADGTLPERVTHNDTKLNNVLIDDVTGKGVCVIDLDTVMPGSVLYDFGDSVRIGAATAAEDEQDLSKVELSLDMFGYLARGYLDAAREFLTPEEIRYLAFSAKLMTFECGIRFLTDYLCGDTYFKVHREGHNLDRCRTQFAMVEDMEMKMEQMNSIVDRYRE